MTRPPLRPLAAAALLAAALAVPATARAQGAAFIDGDPLNVYADGLGRFQVRHDPAPAGDFAPHESNAASAGLNLAFYNSNGVAGPVIGFLASDRVRGDADFIKVRAPTLSGDGSASSPFTLTSTYRVPGRSGFTPTVSPFTTVTERLGYVNGTSEVLAAYVVLASQEFPVRYRASVVGDLYHLTSSDAGGFFQAGPPRYVGAVNLAAGAAGGLVEVPTLPWSAHEVGAVDTLFQKVRTPSGSGFDGTVNPAFLDDAVGVQWDTFRSTPSNKSATVGGTWRFPHFNGLTLDPPSAVAAAGQTHQVQAHFDSGSTLPVGGRGIRWEVTGANPTDGSAVTDPSGDATISWTGANAGEDALAAFIDLNGDGARQPDEPQAIANVEFQPPFGSPTRGVNFNVEPLRGEVLVAEQVPAPDGARAAALTEFRKLTSPAQIRIGSVLDTTRGTVRMTMARNAAGTETQTGDFSRGRFGVTQFERAPMTTLALRGGSFRRCRRDLRKHGAARTARHRRTIRRLRGSASGRFRTRGRRSSATVRGTVWAVQDRCDGTLTSVTQGSVAVRDFAKRRTIVVKRGRRYLARPRRR